MFVLAVWSWNYGSFLLIIIIIENTKITQIKQVSIEQTEKRTKRTIKIYQNPIFFKLTYVAFKMNPINPALRRRLERHLTCNQKKSTLVLSREIETRSRRSRRREIETRVEGDREGGRWRWERVKLRKNLRQRDRDSVETRQSSLERDRGGGRTDEGGWENF